MIKRMNQKSAISKINKNGALLVFPIKNQKAPRSLWSEFYPCTEMRWEWDTKGDTRVSDLWHLMKELSGSKQVVYSKWYQGRASFFSRELFTALVCILNHHGKPRAELSRTGRDLLETLESDSPLSTKQLKSLNDLKGKDNEGIYNRTLKELFSRFLIIICGEIDDGAFPSVALGATSLVYEDLIEAAKTMNQKEAWGIVDQFLPKGNPFRKFFDTILKSISLGPEF